MWLYKSWEWCANVSYSLFICVIIYIDLSLHNIDWLMLPLWAVKIKTNQALFQRSQGRTTVERGYNVMKGTAYVISL